MFPAPHLSQADDLDRKAGTRNLINTISTFIKIPAIYIPAGVMEIMQEKPHIDGLVQGCSNSSALAMELLQSCTKPSILTHWELGKIAAFQMRFLRENSHF